MRRLIILLLLMLQSSTLVACSAVPGESGTHAELPEDEVVLRFVRPQAGQAGPSWVEGYEQLIEAHHPDGVQWVSYTIEGQKKSQGRVSERDAQTDYFHWPRRFKSSSTRSFALQMMTGKGELVTVASVERSYMRAVPDAFAFINLSEGETLAADAACHVLVECTSSSGATHQDTSVKDTDGIRRVAFVVDGVQQPWNDTGRSFGLYQFELRLDPGDHVIGLVAQDSRGELLNGPSVSVSVSR